MVRLNEESAKKLAELASDTGVPASTLAHMATQAMLDAYGQDRHLAIPLTMTLHSGDIRVLRIERAKRSLWERMYPGKPYDLPFGVARPPEYLEALQRLLGGDYPDPAAQAALAAEAPPPSPSPGMGLTKEDALKTGLPALHQALYPAKKKKPPTDSL